jgi:hypothetical protein
MENETKEAARYPLAFDQNGNPIEVPTNAVAWRVRRGGGRRGRPRNVFDAETGRQLEVPLGAGLDDLIEAGCPADRYLLYPVDGEGKVIAGIIAVTEIFESAERDEDESKDEDDFRPSPAMFRELLTSLKASNEMLCRALEATTSGYGPVKAMQSQPVVVEQPAPRDDGGFKAEEIAKMVTVAKSVMDAFKGGAGNGGAVPGGGQGVGS